MSKPTYEELEAQVQGLAAENADLKHPGTYLPSKRETPITDAALAEIRVQGVEIAASELRKLADRSEHEAPIAASHHHAAATFLSTVSAELRKEQGK